MKIKYVLLIFAVPLLAAITLVFKNLESYKRDLSTSLTCSGNICFICTSFLLYHDKYGHFPPAFLVDDSGVPAHSWRVLLLEFIDSDLYSAYRFDEPWNGPNNRKLESRMPKVFSCPSSLFDRNYWQTNYFVVVGPKTLFPGSKICSLDDVKNQKSSTIMFLEADGQGIHWMEPKDLQYNEMSFMIGDRSKPSPSSRHPKGPWASMADCSSVQLYNVSKDQLVKMLHIK